MDNKFINIIDESATIGANVEMGHFNVIGRSVIIESGVKIGNHNVILEGSVLGKHTVIEHHTLLKDHTRIAENCYVDSYFRSSGDNRIDDNVTLRFGCTIARKVIVESNVFISPNVMTIFSKHSGEKSYQTLIKKGAFIGTAAVIGPNVTIEEDVVIGAQAYVSRNCEIKGAIYIGVPAKYLKMKHT